MANKGRKRKGDNLTPKWAAVPKVSIRLFCSEFDAMFSELKAVQDEIKAKLESDRELASEEWAEIQTKQETMGVLLKDFQREWFLKNGGAA